MLKHPRLTFLGGLAGIVVLCVILTVISPIRISISFARDDQAAAAMPRLDITATVPPPPPTEQPTQQPTARPQNPTNTPVPTTPPAPTATPRPAQPTEPPRRTTSDPTPAPPTMTVAPPTATAAPPEQTNVTIVKTADPAMVRHGDRVIFTLETRNTGKITARDVVVTDAVPDAFKVVDLSSSKGDVVVDGQTVTAYPSVLAPNETVTIRITAQVRAEAETGQHRNTALITTSTPGDDPGDNTSTAIVTIQPPAKQAPPVAQQSPPRLPRTAGPDDPTFMMIWGPWLMFAFVVVLFGMMVRFGMLRTRFVTVSLMSLGRGEATPQAAPVAEVMKPAALVVEGIELDSALLLQRWQAGASVMTLTGEIAAENPTTNQIMISLAVQKIIDEHLSQK